MADLELARARALNGSTRRAILRLVQAAAAPVGVRELADQVGVHPNAVRRHLGELCAAELVVEETERRRGVGRPRLVYRPGSAAAGQPGAWNPYESLAVHLAEVAGGRPARAVGRQAGERLASTWATQPTGADEVAGAITGLLRHQGFAPRPTTDGDDLDVVLTACPYASAAMADPVVCALHHGIAEGLAAAAGVELRTFEAAPPAVRACHLRFSLPATDHQGANP